MKKILFGIIMVTVVLSVSFSTILGAGPYDKYLTAADVLKVSGITDVKPVAHNPSVGAGGDLNFATSDGRMIVMAQFVDKRYYADYKKAYFQAAVTGVGEEAFQGATIPNSPPNVIIFRKGDKCIALTGFQDFISWKNMLTIEQIITLAKIIVSRM